MTQAELDRAIHDARRRIRSVGSAAELLAVVRTVFGPIYEAVLPDVNAVADANGWYVDEVAGKAYEGAAAVVARERKGVCDA